MKNYVKDFLPRLFSKRLGAIVLALLFLMVCVASCTSETPEKVESKGESSTQESSKDAQENASGEENKMEKYKIGDMVKLGDLTVIVNEVKDLPNQEFAEPKEGRKLIGVDVTFENVSNEPQAISSLLQFQVKDADGYAYDQSFMYDTGKSLPEGELAPGAKASGIIPYEVPVDANGLEFVFDSDIFGTGQVMISLD